MYNGMFSIPTLEEIIESFIEMNQKKMQFDHNAYKCGLYLELKYPEYYENQDMNVN